MTQDEAKRTSQRLNVEDELKRVRDYIEATLEGRPDFSGTLELNFKGGLLMEISETKRTRIRK